jgi:hypothetical protein
MQKSFPNHPIDEVFIVSILEFTKVEDLHATKWQDVTGEDRAKDNAIHQEL